LGRPPSSHPARLAASPPPEEGLFTRSSPRSDRSMHSRRKTLLTIC
jgi:hypothetical protein